MTDCFLLETFSHKITLSCTGRHGTVINGLKLLDPEYTLYYVATVDVCRLKSFLWDAQSKFFGFPALLKVLTI